jgi:hypothetical protein|tara:strand:- start:193 stop:456 length:264 start_codon:yes stop_codon:yes gene_type:complete
MAKVHETYSAGQFLTASLSHFTLTKTGLATADIKTVVETTSTRATVVILGTISGTSVRIAVENNSAWTDSSLQAALGAGWAVADFTY